MKILQQMVAVVTVAIVMSGCGLFKKTSPVDQTYLAAETYRTVQIAVEGYVTMPDADEGVKVRLKQIDREMMLTLNNMKMAAASGNEDKIEFWSQMMGLLLIQVRTILEAEGVIGPAQDSVWLHDDLYFKKAA